MNKLQKSIAAFWPFWLLAIGAITLGAWMGGDQKPAKPKAPPACPTCPEPEKPNPRSPWGASEASVEAVVAPDGTEPDVEYPADSWFPNTGGSDGSGLCVASSIEMMFRHAGHEEMRGFRKYCESYPGGSYPSKAAKQIAEFCAKKGIPVPKYYQYEGRDLTFLKNALRSGRYACCTLYLSARYGGRISHMTNCGHASGPRYAAIVDNNRMRNDEIPPYEWFDGDDKFLRAIGGGGGYWAIVCDRPGLPCPPKN